MSCFWTPLLLRSFSLLLQAALSIHAVILAAHLCVYCNWIQFPLRTGNDSCVPRSWWHWAGSCAIAVISLSLPVERPHLMLLGITASISQPLCSEGSLWPWLCLVQVFHLLHYCWRISFSFISEILAIRSWCMTSFCMLLNFTSLHIFHLSPHISVLKVSSYFRHKVEDEMAGDWSLVLNSCKRI